MNSKTKIIVLHLKELIYTGIFVVLGILFLLLLLIMFLPGKKTTPDASGADSGIYTPGKYTTSLILGSSAVDVEVVVDDNNINSIRLVNLDEAVTTMYPLMEPALNDLADQICAKQSMEDLSYSDDNKYTAQVLLEAIASALSKAEKEPGSVSSRSTSHLTEETQAEEAGTTYDSGSQEGTGSEDGETGAGPQGDADSQGDTEPQGDSDSQTQEGSGAPDGSGAQSEAAPAEASDRNVQTAADGL